jgi:Tol biopolymer transport system component/predicted Ser/Thr protein kinase
MPLKPGARLGPFEILAQIGAGGMGEVYKARDTRLDRIVAIKTSRQVFTERFEREARAIAALNHPNICQLYDVGPEYLVMEFIDGNPVAPVDSPRKLLDIAVQIADGLAAAHGAGIVHRDLKPENILLARDGRVRILDFGLAKQAAAASGSRPVDATRTVALTDAGTTVGTIAYMSPEQARGDPELTPQSDQFSFGLVLYEMLTGKRAFQRASMPEIMTAIIREDFTPLPPTVLAPLRWIVERLLAKDPAERYDSTRDLFRELRHLRDHLSQSSSSIAVPVAEAISQPARAKSWLERWRPAAVTAGAALIAFALAWIVRPAGGFEQLRFTPMEVAWENPSGAVWSPDGKAFAYVAGASSHRRLFVRYLDSPTATTLTPEAAGDWYAAGWSPDSRHVIVRGKNPKGETPRFALYSASVVGGEPDLLMPIESAFPRISPDGSALAAVVFDGKLKLGVLTASPVGSPLRRYEPTPFATADFANSPLAQFSPDNRSILLVIDVTGGRQAWLLPYPPGKAEPKRILENLPNTGFTPRWSWFPGGSNAVMSLVTERGYNLWLVGMHTGLKRQITANITAQNDTQPALSPAGDKLLFVREVFDNMILSVSLSDAAVERVISSEVQSGMPAWALNKDEMVYESKRGGTTAIWMRSEGKDRPIVTTDHFPAGSTVGFATPALSPAGDRIEYTRTDKDQRFATWISSLGGGPPVRLTNTRDSVERGGSWSPDGSRIVYWQYHDGRPSLMIARTTGEATPALLREINGNTLPDWSPDGQWIAFLDRVGLNVISPDGTTIRSFEAPDTAQVTFSRDSKLLYGIRVGPTRCILFSIDIATKQTKTIGEFARDFVPSSYSNPGIRLSLSPDGKSILFPAQRSATGLWMLEGFTRPGWWDNARETIGW